MDLSHKDFNTILSLVENTKDMLSWQMPSDIPTINAVHANNNKVHKLLMSYLDLDGESTTQLELFPEEGDDGDNTW